MSADLKQSGEKKAELVETRSNGFDHRVTFTDPETPDEAETRLRAAQLMHSFHVDSVELDDGRLAIIIREQDSPERVRQISINSLDEAGDIVGSVIYEGDHGLDEMADVLNEDRKLDADRFSDLRVEESRYDQDLPNSNDFIIKPNLALHTPSARANPPVRSLRYEPDTFTAGGPLADVNPSQVRDLNWRIARTRYIYATNVPLIGSTLAGFGASSQVQTLVKFSTSNLGEGVSSTLATAAEMGTFYLVLFGGAKALSSLLKYRSLRAYKTEGTEVSEVQQLSFRQKPTPIWRRVVNAIKSPTARLILAIEGGVFAFSIASQFALSRLGLAPDVSLAAAQLTTLAYLTAAVPMLSHLIRRPTYNYNYPRIGEINDGLPSAIYDGLIKRSTDPKPRIRQHKSVGPELIDVGTVEGMRVNFMAFAQEASHLGIGGVIKFYSGGVWTYAQIAGPPMLFPNGQIGVPLCHERLPGEPMKYSAIYASDFDLFHIGNHAESPSKVSFAVQTLLPPQEIVGIEFSRLDLKAATGYAAPRDAAAVLPKNIAMWGWALEQERSMERAEEILGLLDQHEAVSGRYGHRARTNLAEFLGGQEASLNFAIRNLGTFITELMPSGLEDPMSDPRLRELIIGLRDLYQIQLYQGGQPFQRTELAVRGSVEAGWTLGVRVYDERLSDFVPEERLQIDTRPNEIVARHSEASGPSGSRDDAEELVLS